jgi:hypothetical protein
MQVKSLHRLRRRLLCPVGSSLLLLLAVWVILAPAEAQLGNLIKLVYVHGALVIAGLAAFSLAGLLGLVALTTRKPAWFLGAEAAGQGALLVWIVYALSAMAVTKLAWGQLIAWNEPRVRVTALILVAAVVLELAIRLVSQRTFGAAVRVVMAVAPWLATRKAEVIRHPADPIGGSGSASIQAFFLLILLTVGLLVLDLLAWLWVGSELRQAGAGDEGKT